MNYKVIFAIVSFCVSEFLPFFPSIESNGVVHGIVKIMQAKDPSIKHSCATHPPVEMPQDSLNKIKNIFKKNPEKKNITNFFYIGDIDRNKKFSIEFKVFKK